MGEVVTASPHPPPSALKPVGIEQETESSNQHHPTTGTRSRTATPLWAVKPLNTPAGLQWSLSSPLLSQAGPAWSESQRPAQRLVPEKGSLSPRLGTARWTGASLPPRLHHPSCALIQQFYSEGVYGVISLQTPPACCRNTRVALTQGHTREQTAKPSTAEAQQPTNITAASIPQKWWAP